MLRVTAELVTAILTKRAVEHLPESLDQLQRLDTDLRQLDAQEAAEKKRHREALAALERVRQAVQQRCPHWLVRHQGDPAGGSDSCDRCELCGCEWDRSPGGYDG